VRLIEVASYIVLALIKIINLLNKKQIVEDISFLSLATIYCVLVSYRVLYEDSVRGEVTTNSIK
jgi:hypothetical protein